MPRKAALRRALAAAPPPAWVPLTELCVLRNDDRSRTFLALEAAEAGAGAGAAAAVAALRRTIAAVDAAFGAHGLPPFYDPPRPHVSLAWAPGDVAAALEATLAAVPHAQRPAWHATVGAVQLAVGQRMHDVWPAAAPCGDG